MKFKRPERVVFRIKKTRNFPQRNKKTSILAPAVIRNKMRQLVTKRLYSQAHYTHAFIEFYRRVIQKNPELLDQITADFYRSGLIQKLNGILKTKRMKPLTPEEIRVTLTQNFRIPITTPVEMNSLFSQLGNADRESGSTRYQNMAAQIRQASMSLEENKKPVSTDQLMLTAKGLERINPVGEWEKEANGHWYMPDEFMIDMLLFGGLNPKKIFTKRKS